MPVKAVISLCWQTWNIICDMKVWMSVCWHHLYAQKQCKHVGCTQRIAEPDGGLVSHLSVFKGRRIYFIMPAQTRLKWVAFLQLSKVAHALLYRVSFRSPHGTSVHILCWEGVRQLTNIQIVPFELTYLGLRLVGFQFRFRTRYLSRVIPQIVGMMKNFPWFNIWTC